MGSAPRKCLVCGKPCVSSDRNTDGSYAHRECLYATALHPVARSKRGRNLYNVEGEEK